MRISVIYVISLNYLFEYDALSVLHKMFKWLVGTNTFTKIIQFFVFARADLLNLFHELKILY